jgi:uncharacterized membrane protein YccC
VAAVAVWICFCNFAARAVRNFASYGFQLAGYTVAIVGIPAALAPTGAYDLLLARFTEISLGIICAALVSRLILLRELSPKLIELVVALARRAESFAALLLDPHADSKHVTAERTELAKAYLDIQAMQQSTYFESAEARVLNQPPRRLTQAAMELCTTAEAAASHRAGSLPHPEKATSSGIGIAPNQSLAGDGPITLRWCGQRMSATWSLRVPGFASAWEPSTGVRNCPSRASRVGFGRTRCPRL